MRCKEFEERISAYLEGELTAAETGLFVQHATCCPACSQILDGVRGVRRVLRSLAYASAPASYKLRIAGRLQEQLARTSIWLRSAVLGLGLATGIAILLWPQTEPPGSGGVTQSRSMWTRHADAWVGRSRVEADVEPVPAMAGAQRSIARYPYAQVRQASF